MCLVWLLLLPVSSQGDCTFTFNVPDHAAGTPQTVTVSVSSTCIAGSNVSVGFSCAYQKPTTGSLPVIVNNNNVVCDGSYSPISLNFVAGVATLSVMYADVGQMQLNASYTGFLTGSDNFITVPAYFDLVLTPVCTGYAYSGQPFQVQATAKSLDGGTTLNYDGTTNTSPNQANLVNLSETSAGSVGSLTNGSIPYSAFTKGVGTVTATASSPVSYTFTSQTAGPPTQLTSIQLHAVDSVNSSVTSQDHETAATTVIRRGRLSLYNVIGSENSTLSMPVLAQYWDGLSWVINKDDNCTAIPTSTLSLIYSGTGGAPTATGTTLTLAGGKGNIVFNPPTGTGSVDVAVNLGASGVDQDQSCLSSHGGTASNQPWLRSQNGSCSTTYDRDPSARASFGIYAPETTKLMHVRELY